MSRIAGLLLAAGSGRRFGMPKALADTGDGPWVLTALRVLAGCEEKIVVVGAAADEVAALLPADAILARNPDHASGMASSLRGGLAAVADDGDAVLITLVDLPDGTAAVAARV
ncbi:MAG: nucleotidyltransferase family protein, partial [Nakamurella sp.]